MATTIHKLAQDSIISLIAFLRHDEQKNQFIYIQNLMYASVSALKIHL